eukprot:CAMPEP_0170631528 /NCGR_PEP_ID=MMETSP0224-20130122/34699_1 /TAXON_ID=285029 /ORGANISM="Togula jolla, Strain CCCM 725" /LENGTH=38 /DNA_ID= /DNA_START= /DNA_END= /DNA_ORIENTATION=
MPVFLMLHQLGELPEAFEALWAMVGLLISTTSYPASFP